MADSELAPIDGYSISQDFYVCICDIRGKFSALRNYGAVGLTAAAIEELVWGGWASFDGERFHCASGADAPAEPPAYLQGTLALMRKKDPITLQKLIADFGYSFASKPFKSLAHDVGVSLVPDDMAYELKTIGKPRYVPTKKGMLAVSTEAREQFLAGKPFTPQVAGMMALVVACRCLDSMFRGTDAQIIRRKLKDFDQQELADDACKRAVADCTDMAMSILRVIGSPFAIEIDE